MSKRRVVVTGLGIISPVGNNIDTAWDNVLNGRSGVGPITRFDASGFATRLAAEVKDFSVDPWLSKKDAKKFDVFVHYGVAAGIQALEDSGLEVTDENADRIGVAVGSGIGGLPLIEASTQTYLERGPRRISPFFIPSTIVNMAAGQLSIMTGAKGPNVSIVTACTTGAHNIGFAARTIAYGDADAMIAGGCEATVSPLAVGGFCSAKAMSTRNDDPAGASRPWDAERDGFVMGEGAGIVVLEEYESAKARGATIYAEVAGFGMSSDAYHVTSPPAGGEGARRCMQAAVKDAGLNVTEIGYINAHGTSTPVGDIAETDAVKAMYGANTPPPMSSTKSVTGHLLGAAGGVEAIFSILALRDNVLPPTINLENPDPACNLDYVSDGAREVEIQHALSNSFGFGGTNGSLIFSKI
ncbi:MAG: 3-oxoacyl-[acyl-carrier-protein] synthase II [Pseudoalteromonas tetraodonis]|jgi:3-oxoacyl-[acyl-carrier-protein] synthase II